MRALFLAVVLLTGCAARQQAAELTIAVQLRSMERPAWVLSDPAFAHWTREPNSRSELREALREHAVAAPIGIVQPDEPGEPLMFDATVVDERTGEPIVGALALIVNADAEGRYSPEGSSWNPRIFGWVRTDDTGGLWVVTIRPSGYASEGEGDSPAHLHVTIEAEGYRTYGGEVLLADDPLFTPESIARERADGALIETPTQGDDGMWYLRARIPMQRER